MKQGKAKFLCPENKRLTTQAAANMLGMSRLFLVSLLEKGAISHYKVAGHRRDYLRDLEEYHWKRDSKSPFGDG